MKIFQEKGVTLTELIVVIVVIGILAGIGTPIYTNMTENSRQAEAQTALGVIYMGEKIYASNNGSVYWPNPSGSATDIGTINTNLNIDIENLQFFDLSIDTTATKDCSGAAIASPTFLAKATRKAGGPARTWCVDPTTGAEAVD